MFKKLALVFGMLLVVLAVACGSDKESTSDKTQNDSTPVATKKATKAARAHVVPVTLVGATLPHEIIGRCGASKVFMKPAAPGTGIIAGASVRAVLELCGVRDVLSKAYGSTNPVNLVKATFDAVTRLRSKASVASLRGVEIK